MQLNEVSVTGLRGVLTLGAEIDLPTIILGTFGIGKSAIINQSLSAMGYTLVDFRAGEVLPEDVGGIGVVSDASNGTKVVIRAVPDLVQACWQAHARTGQPVALFLDELTSALPSVQAALYQVFLDKKAGGHPLPPGTYTVAAGNLATDRGVVEELARPLLNRAQVYHYTGPTFDEFERLMVERDFHPIIRTYLKVNTGDVVRIDSESEQSATPRSWERGSDALKSPTSRVVGRMLALSGIIGGDTAQKLEAFLDMHDKLVPIEEIMAHPTTAKLPSPSDFAAQYMQLTALASAVVRTKGVGTAEAVAAAWTYCKRCSPEVASIFILSMTGDTVTHLMKFDQTLFALGSPFIDVMRLIMGSK